MTDERLNELACKAGFGGVSRNTHRAKLALFANMVAADAREACAKVCELGMDTSPDAELSEWSRAHNNACRTRAIAIRLLGYEP
jgi:hypothetical protein